MSSRKQKRVASALPVPQTPDQAAAVLAEIGVAQRELALIETAMNSAIAEEQKRSEEAAAPHRKRVEELTAGLQIWAEANRDALTNNRARQTATLPTGEIGWRKQPASVRVGDMKAAIAHLVADAKLARFVRTKVELNKEAMLAEPAKMQGVPGIRIGSAGEAFYAAPTEIALAEGPAS